MNQLSSFAAFALAPPDESRRRLVEAERTVIAEAQRLVLSSGREIVAHCAAVAGVEAGRFADRCCDTVLWSRSSPETWPLSRLLGLLERQPPEVAINGPREAWVRVRRAGGSRGTSLV